MDPVLVKRYKNEMQLQRDAAEAAQAGYRIVSVAQQTEGASIAAVIWLLVALLFFALGFVAFWPLMVLGFIALLLAMTGRTKSWVATYQFSGPTW